MKKKFNLFLEEKGISKADFLAKAAAEQGELHNEFQESQFKGLEDLISKKLDSSEIESLKKDGTLSAEINGGVAPYFILWSNGSTNKTITNVGRKNFMIRVSDSKGNVVEELIILKSNNEEITK